MSTRLDVRKTYKLYIGGNFVRSESGRYLPAKSAAGAQLDNVCLASRKDFRDAVAAARTAQDGWAKKSAYLRGQILYRAAEMLQNRSVELVSEIARSTGASAAKAKREVTLAIDRLVHFAGWTDKFAQVFGSVNPVATSHFDFTTPEPTGVVVVLLPDEPSLVALVSLVTPRTGERRAANAGRLAGLVRAAATGGAAGSAPGAGVFSESPGACAL
jgi:acyl-CoA reductase-like NAD-dependent aldehyde dehydrogenase